MTDKLKQLYEMKAYKIANERLRFIRFPSMLFLAGPEFLLLEWNRNTWNPRWLGKAHDITFRGKRK